MVNSKLTDGVGKKIVEALKQQSDIEIQPIAEPVVSDEVYVQEASSDFSGDYGYGNEADEEPVYVEDETPLSYDEPLIQEYSQPEPMPAVSFEQQIMPQPQVQNFSNLSASIPFSQPVQSFESENLLNELDGFDIPTNVAVLKQLITQLPAGVTKQTGAQIIRQTMEALGISMKGVLTEAQQVQENLTNSSRECQNNIAEYKRQIGVLEAQSQKFQKQYAALNDIISLFVQTN